MKWKDRMTARMGAEAVIKITDNPKLLVWLRDFSPGGDRCHEPNADIIVDVILKTIKERKKLGYE
jgi:hypothetical protein